MKISFWAIISAALASTAAVVEYSVNSCADFMAVDENALTSLVVTSSPIECAHYLRFVVRNDITLSATVPQVVLSNISLVIKDGLEVVIEPDIVFRDVYQVVKNGGALSISEECTVTFIGMAKFMDSSVRVKQLPPVSCGPGCNIIAPGESYVTKKGGAIHNKGELIFQEDAFFMGCSSMVDVGSTERARGGAISNSGSGVIHFKGDLTMNDNYAGGVFDGQGGAIYNRGDIVVDGDAVFYDNSASDGGGFYQEKWGSFETNGMANFTDNYAEEYRGGGICNLGGVVNMNAGSVFHNNVAECSGECGSGGAIYNEDRGVVTLAGPTIFTENDASFGGGAIFNQEVSGSNSQEDYEIPVITLPDDVAFLNNTAMCGADIFNGDYSTCPSRNG